MYMSKLWVHPEKRRYYRASVYKDLLGQWILARDWGSLDSRLGGTKMELLAGVQEGNEKLIMIGKRRVSHRYALVENGK